MAAPNPDADPGTPDELPDDAVEARWADIVAQLGQLDGPDAPERSPESPSTSRPTTEPSTGPTTDSAPTGDGPAPQDGGSTTPAAGTGPRDWPSTPEVDALEEADSHFTPPEPEPILDRDPLLTMAWSVVAAVPILTVVLFVVRATLPSLHLPGWLGPVGGGLFLAAIAVLLWRMPHRRDPEDDGTGAVV